MLTHFSCVRLFETLWTIAFKAPPFMGFSRQEYWSGLPCPPPRDRPIPGIEPVCVFYVSCIGRQVPYHQHHLGRPITKYRLYSHCSVLIHPESALYPIVCMPTHTGNHLLSVTVSLLLLLCSLLCCIFLDK